MKHHRIPATPTEKANNLTHTHTHTRGGDSRIVVRLGNLTFQLTSCIFILNLPCYQRYIPIQPAKALYTGNSLILSLLGIRWLELRDFGVSFMLKIEQLVNDAIQMMYIMHKLVEDDSKVK